MNNKNEVFPPLSNESIREAVRLWRDDQAQASAKYNHINKWNTSQVTDMRELFRRYQEFNDNISEWDVSNVTNMSDMFFKASSFNQDVSGWDVSNVTNMSYMFYGASSFNQDVSEWDVSNVTDMSSMFSGALSFNQDVSGWDVSNVINMSYMFSYSESFNQDVSGWDVSNVTDVSWMFNNTSLENFLIELLDCRSFFGGMYFDMPKDQRQRMFSLAFAWRRRQSYILFLARCGYLPCSGRMFNAVIGQGYEGEASSHAIGLLEDDGSTREKNVDVLMPCDVLFNVEDMYRYICKFL